MRNSQRSSVGVFVGIDCGAALGGFDDWREAGALNHPLGRVVKDEELEIVRGAELSIDELYRYELRRTWGPGQIMAWVMLNPSTADAYKDDQTIKRCMFYAQREGYDGIVVVNRYAYRCTQPSDLLKATDPNGPQNIEAWDKALSDHRVGMIVAAWGASTPKGLRASTAAAGWPQAGWFCLGKTASRHPRHPSRLGNDAQLVPWRIPR